MSTRDTQRIIQKLGDEMEPLDASTLVDLSNLTREEQQWLDEAWEDIPLDKRRRLVALMNEQAEEDFQLDFSAVLRRGIRDEDAEVRRAAIEGLWEDESVTLIRPFLKLLHEDASPDVRASAASALGRFVLLGELGRLTDERSRELVESLVTIVADRSLPIDVQRRAVESLAYSSDDRVRSIIGRAYEDESADMRASAIFAMGRSADEYWRGAVRAELFNEDPAHRFEAARAAGELADPRAVERLIVLLKDRDRQIRIMAIWALGQIGGAAARRALKQVAQADLSREARQHARESLAEMALLADETIAFVDDPELYDEAGEDDGDYAMFYADDELDEDDESDSLVDDDEDDTFYEDDALFEDDEEWEGSLDPDETDEYL
jgi:HEAT repeat protein